MIRTSYRTQPAESILLCMSSNFIRQGYGHSYTKYPFYPARMEEFRAAEREARENGRGLWGPSHQRWKVTATKSGESR